MFKANRTTLLAQITFYVVLAFCLAVAFGYFKAAKADGLPVVVNDQFNAAVVVKGVQLFDNPFGGTAKHWFLNSFVDKKTGDVTNQLVVGIIYSSDTWAFYDHASDDSAQQLAVVSINRSVVGCFGAVGCDFDEMVGVVLPNLKDRQAGFQVKVTAQDGSWVTLPVTSDMIAKQLVAIDQQQSAVEKKNVEDALTNVTTATKTVSATK